MLKEVYMKLCHQSLRQQQTLVSEQVCFLLSFPHNNNGWLEHFIQQQTDKKIVLAGTKAVYAELEPLAQAFAHVELVSLAPSWRFFHTTLAYLQKSQTVFADNYFAFLAAWPKRTEQNIIQLWHANGAIKRFGLDSPKNQKRSPKDKARFQAVYDRFTHYVVGSKKMGEVFQRSYLAQAEQILPFGFVRTDAYFDYKKRASWTEEVKMRYPEWEGKRVLLYAPTYRDEKEIYPFPKAEISAEKDWVLVEHYHPHSALASTPLTISMEALLQRADVLITDYSSLPFDYTLLNPQGQLVFYQFDRASYAKKEGLQPNLADWPGPIVETKEALLQVLKQVPSFDFTLFNEEWNNYNQGTAVTQLLQFLEEKA